MERKKVDEKTCLVRLVAEEVDLFETFVLDVLERVGLVPSSREDVKADHTTDGVGEVVFGELGFEGVDEGGSDLVHLWGEGEDRFF